MPLVVALQKCGLMRGPAWARGTMSVSARARKWLASASSDRKETGASKCHTGVVLTRSSRSRGSYVGMDRDFGAVVTADTVKHGSGVSNEDLNSPSC